MVGGIGRPWGALRDIQYGVPMTLDMYAMIMYQSAGVFASADGVKKYDMVMIWAINIFPVPHVRCRRGL